MGSQQDITLNGAIDKRGHRDFIREHQRNPDFVFHTQGTHANYTIVVEVKGRIDDQEGVLKDFETLCTFINHYYYQLGIFIVYNHTVLELMYAIEEYLPIVQRDPAAGCILILSIETAFDDCTEIPLMALLK
ncbi:MAG: hypothetical protein M3R24_32050 [Chloroflexota bacterium]|nr:hypothetical protein [Chloroflexota bacterium]